MRQKTNENKSTSCVYQELNPEMDAFLAGYLEDGRHRGLRESTIISMTRSAITFYPL